MIDVNRAALSPPGISLVRDGIAMVAKRIEHVPHSDPSRVILKSLDPDYGGREYAAEEVRIVGRAGWVSRKV